MRYSELWNWDSVPRSHCNENSIYVILFWELRGDCGRVIPFLGIFVSNFLYWFFAVQDPAFTFWWWWSWNPDLKLLLKKVNMGMCCRFTYPHSSSLFYRCTTFARQVFFSVYISAVFNLISPSMHSLPKTEKQNRPTGKKSREEFSLSSIICIGNSVVCWVLLHNDGFCNGCITKRILLLQAYHSWETNIMQIMTKNNTFIFY